MARLKTKTGKALSRDRVEKLAEEAERGFDLGKATREAAKGGRPALESGVSPGSATGSATRCIDARGPRPSPKDEP